jgi:hypothetical protein
MVNFASEKSIFNKGTKFDWIVVDFEEHGLSYCITYYNCIIKYVYDNTFIVFYNDKVREVWREDELIEHEAYEIPAVIHIKQHTITDYEVS